MLSPDDADRARFALSREIGRALVLRVERSGTRVTIELPGWLPRPEYRWLSLHALVVPESKNMRWEVSSESDCQITTLLAERLGLTVEAT
jgi:hypothetical protein